ncbi:MAG: outer membrane beta-barrel protein [Chitinophagaceae bacterium]|nr:outer membrane beta-barrel protein [Chitinophagaceae bacterium]
MENQKYQDEFEQFLHDEVKQHRMYPSDRVWTNIRTELHGHRSWPALTFISLFIITALTLSTVLSTQENFHPQPLSIPNIAKVEQETLAAHKAAGEKSRHYFNKLAPVNITLNTIAAIDYPITDVFATNNSLSQTELSFPKGSIQHQPIIKNKAASIFLISPMISLNKSAYETLQNEYPTSTEGTIIQQADEAVAEKNISLFHENIPTLDDPSKDFHYVKNQNLNRPAVSKFGFQFYITPSTSYRRLSDEKVKEIIQPSVASLPVNAPLNQPSNINEVVRHRPAVGLELGFAVLYNITSRLKLKTGLQLNIRQYHIETFQSRTYDPTTISLINFNGVENITRFSPYNNNVGYKQTELENKVYQLAIPVGIQWDVIRGKHMGINMEASVQPTFNLNKSVYLLSTDYRHYAEGNDLVRKWNINTSVGLNLSYKAGKTSWQIGPQVRYQHLPTYSNKYPIKEYLMDYGMRIGLTRALQ